MNKGTGIIYLILFSLLLQVITSCNDRPKDIMSERKSVDVLTDISIATASFDTGQGQETGFNTKEEAQRGVLAKHDVSIEEYRKTMEWYGKNLDKYEDVRHDVNKRLLKKLTKIDPDAKNTLSDENNIWPLPDHLIFTPGMLSDGVVFSISDPAIDKGGYTELKLKTSEKDVVLSILLGVDYEDGTSSFINRMPSGFDEVKVRLQSDSTRIAKRLFGYMRTNAALTKTLTVDSITLIKMPFDSTEYYRISSQTRLSN